MRRRLLLIRGYLAYVVAVKFPLDRISVRAWSALLPWAGDWIYHDQGGRLDVAHDGS